MIEVEVPTLPATGREPPGSSPSTGAAAPGRPLSAGATVALPDSAPAVAGGFVGRHEALAMLAELIGRCPVVTLTGPPGVGKTRLAREVVARMGADVRSHLVDLSAVGPARVTEEVVAALGVREERTRPLLDTLAAHLGDEGALLVLDNCEHVVEAAAEAVVQLACVAPQVRVVATSQERLRIDGERVWEVAPLSLPPRWATDVDQVVASEAVQLFCARATAVRAGFTVSPANAAAVADICRRVDGLPLAVELAAALMGVSSPEVVAASLDGRFALLCSGSRSAPARHQTLLDAIEWSYRLLAPPEQALLRRLSVFAGGAGSEGIRHVCAAEGQAWGQLLALLTRLVERSLVAVDLTGADPRYHLLESIAHFAAEKAAAAGEDRAGRERHLAWCLALARHAAPRGGPPPEVVTTEEDNLRAALEWATAEGRSPAALALAGAYLPLCRRAGRYREARQWAERVLALPETAGEAGSRVARLRDVASLAAVAGDFEAALAAVEEAQERLGEDADAGDRADALVLGGLLATFARCPDAALETLERALVLARTSGRASTLSEALVACGRARMLVGEVRSAQGHFGEALAVAARSGARVTEADAHVGLGWAALVLGEHEAARSHLAEATTLAESLDAGHVRAVAAAWSGELARRRGDHAEARAHFGVAREVGRAIETPYPYVRALVGLAWVAFAQGDLEVARALGEEALALARRSANGYLIAPALVVLGRLARARGDTSAGRALLEEARAVARGRRDRLAEAAVHGELGWLAAAEGATAVAAAAHHRALALAAGVGHRPGVAESLEALGGLAIAGARFGYGVRLLAAAEALRDRLGYPRTAEQGEAVGAQLETARAALGTEELDRLFAQGAALGLDEAVAYARRRRGAQSRAPAGCVALTAAERQVAELVAEGLTNPEIAQRLFISPRTVQTHLRHIFTKLGVRTRAGLVRATYTGR